MSIFWKNLTIIANDFLKLQIPKTWSDKCLKSFTVPFKKQHGNRTQTLSKSEQRLIYHNFWSLRRQLSLQKSFLGICKILRLFGNTFTADDKYSLLSGDNLRQPIQMQLSQTQNVFSHFFSIVLKFRLNFEYLKKNDTHS